MAAIFGIRYFGTRESDLNSDLQKMAKIMAHRGGKEAEFVTLNSVGLGHLHLRPRPAERSEPYSRDLEVIAVVDGRIYSSELTEHGTQDDSLVSPREPSCVIKSTYSEHGAASFAGLNGDFAAAIWDGLKDRLILARDRFGARPLYYFEDKEKVIFASEIKAIIEVLAEKPSLNFSLIPEYLTFRYTYGDETMFEGVKELLPGQCLEWNGRSPSRTQYWRPEDVLMGGQIDSAYSTERASELLRKAVSRRLKYSEKTGANCSGGIDSGLATIFASELLDEPVHSYTVGFEERDWDERFYAGLTAHRAGTHHHEIEVKSEDFSADLARLNWYNDEPLSDPNSVLLYVLAKYSRESVDLLLTGEGADEVALGYPRYNLFNLYTMLSAMPSPLKSLVIKGLSISGNRRLNKLSNALTLDPVEAIIFNSAFAKQEMIGSLLNPDIGSAPFSSRRNIVETMGDDFDPITKLMVYEIRTYLLSSMKRLDKMNMAAGLETTTPFLDNEFFDYSLRTPSQSKITLLDNKRVLREIGAQYLPRENMKMPKSGFGVPIAAWFRTDAALLGILNDLENDSEMLQIFRQDGLSRIISEHLSGQSDNSEILWLLTNFHIWKKQFFS